MTDMSLWGQKRYPNRYAPFLTPLEAPTSGVFDPPYICVPINIHWAAFVRGALSALQRDEIWQGDENQRFDAIQQILELTAAMVNQRPECEAACMIRVSPTDTCQIQQSLNGGETWDDIFRLDSCFVTPIVQVEAVEGGNLVRFDMNADSFPEEEVFIPDGVQGDPGDPGDPAPTPIVTISEPTPGNHLIEFDMDGNGIPEDAVLISDGENAAVPIVSVNAVEGGTNVAFDMNADTFPEETVFIPDGVQGDPGDPAPTPIVAVNAVEGGNLVSFDMDADTIPEEFVFIPDGENGATIIQDVSEPELPPADMGVDLRCNSALHTAEKMQQYLLEHLDQFDLALDLQSALVSIVVGISNIAGRLGRLGEDYEVFEEINQVGSTSLRTTINSSTWVNDIKCLAYGILDSDGVWDDTKVTAFIDAIEASSVGAKTFTATWLRAVKLYGFSYSARLEQNASADCSDCSGGPGLGDVDGATWIADYEFIVNNTAQGWFEQGGGTLTSTGWQAGSGQHFIAVNFDVPAGRSGNILACRVWQNEVMNGNRNVIGYQNFGVGSQTIVNTTDTDIFVELAPRSYVGGNDIGVTASEYNAGTGVHSPRIERIVLWGDGDNPFA